MTGASTLIAGIRTRAAGAYGSGFDGDERGERLAAARLGRRPQPAGAGPG